MRITDTLEIAVFCINCNSAPVLHADGSMYCSCDSLEHRPLGEVPEAWEMSEADFRLWSEVESGEFCTA